MINTDYEPSDPEFWPWEELREFEETMCCPICKELIKHAMSPSCSHTFCSACIRYALDEKSSCPVCKKDATQGDLKPNLMVDHILNSFRKARVKLVEHVQTSNNQKIEIPKQIEIEQPKIKMSDFIPPLGEFVECPKCNTRLRSQFIHSHLDACTSNTEITTSQTSIENADSSQRIKNNLNIATMSLTQIKQKLQEYGITSKDIPKDTPDVKSFLFRRLKDFILEWNINIDTGSKRTMEQVVDRVLAKEKQRTSSKLNLFKHKQSPPIFNRLIAETKERSKRQREEQEEKNKKLKMSPILVDCEVGMDEAPAEPVVEDLVTIIEDEIIQFSPDF